MGLVVTSASSGEATALMSVARYRLLSGDTTSSSSDITVALTDAVRLIEEYLRRKLSNAVYTETLDIDGDRVYPTNGPVTDPGPYVLHHGALVGVSPDWTDALVWNLQPHFGRKPQATVTYTGGWTATTLPAHIAHAILDETKAALERSASSVTQSVSLTGASSVSVGDVKVGYGGQSETSTDSTPNPGVLGTTTARNIARYRRRYL